MAKARGFSAERQDAERLAGCAPELAGVRMDGQHTCGWMASILADGWPAYVRLEWTAPVVPAGGLPRGTPRTRDRVCTVHWPAGHPTRGQRPCAYRQSSTGVRAEEAERAIHPHA